MEKRLVNVDCLEWYWTSNNNELLVTNVFYHNVVSLGRCCVTINFWKPGNPKFVTFDNLSHVSWWHVSWSHVSWLFGKCGNLGFIMFVQLFSLQFESVRNKTRFRKPSGFEFSVEINFCWNFSFCQIAFLGSLLPIQKYSGHFIIRKSPKTHVRVPFPFKNRSHLYQKRA